MMIMVGDIQASVLGQLPDINSDESNALFMASQKTYVDDSKTLLNQSNHNEVHCNA